MSKLLKVYESILRFSGLDIDDEGYVVTSSLYNGKRNPALLEGIRIVLPTEAHLRTANSKEKVIFHPLNENIMDGESRVVAKLREIINVRLNYTIGIIGQRLIQIAGSPTDHNNLTPEQLEMVFAVKDTDSTAASNFSSMMVAALNSNYNRAFCNIYLSRGATINGTRYGRAGIVNFPILDELAKNPNEPYGAKIRVKDLQTFKNLFEYIFPDINVPESYSRGSKSPVAPFLDALMSASAAVASKLNDIIIMFEGYFDEADQIIFDAEWMEAFNNLDDLIPEIRRIPQQAMNDSGGRVGSTSTVPAPSLDVVTSPVATTGAVVQQQVIQAPPVVQFQQPVKPEIRTTSRGVDFNSLKAANPALAATPGMFPGQMPNMMMHQQQMQAPPSWAGTGQPSFAMQNQQPQMGMPGMNNGQAQVVNVNGVMMAMVGNQLIPIQGLGQQPVVQQQQSNNWLTQPAAISYKP